jgi:hypothetical protein
MPARACREERLLGAKLTISGGTITDVNSEGSSPATQFFIDKVTLAKDKQPSHRHPVEGRLPVAELLPECEPFADSGADGYLYHVIKPQSTSYVHQHFPL